MEFLIPLRNAHTGAEKNFHNPQQIADFLRDEANPEHWEGHAHQHAGIVLKHLDSIAGMKTEQPVQWVDGAFVPSAEMAAPAEPEGLQLDGANGLRLVKG